MLCAHVAALRELLGEAENPYLPRPPLDMEKRRKGLLGKRPRKSRKAGRFKVARPRTRRKRRLTAQQHAIVKVQQARRKKDVTGMRYWNNKVARHSRNQ